MVWGSLPVPFDPIKTGWRRATATLLATCRFRGTRCIPAPPAGTPVSAPRHPTSHLMELWPGPDIERGGIDSCARIAIRGIMANRDTDPIPVRHQEDWELQNSWLRGTSHTPASRTRADPGRAASISTAPARRWRPTSAGACRMARHSRRQTFSQGRRFSGRSSPKAREIRRGAGSYAEQPAPRAEGSMSSAPFSGNGCHVTAPTP